MRACGSAEALPVAHDVDPGTAEALKARLVALADTASGQRTSAGDGDGGERAISCDGSRWCGRDDGGRDEGTKARQTGAKTLGK